MVKILKKPKKAFTLVEAMISMIIIMIVTATMVPALTKVKPRIETVTRRGQYACWFEGGTLKEQYMDERTARRPAQSVSECKLSLDQRPARYYIIAAGAGNNNVQGQVVTKYTSGIASDLDITLGTLSNGGATVVRSDDTGNDEVRALGGESASNGLIPRNIKSCKLLSAGTACPNISGKVQESCEVVEAVDNSVASTNTSTKDYRIRINGCDAYDDEGNISWGNLFDPKALFYAGTSLYLADSASSSTINNFALQNGNYYYTGNVKMNFEFYDSEFLSKRDNKSKMSKIVDTISIQRKSTLTDLIVNLNAGAPGKNGAVLILW